MGNYEFTIALRIRHPNIAPAEVTRNLGIEPLHAWRAGDPLVGGPSGLLQPASDAAPLVPDMVLVPLIGFDRALHRLGQGAGYYDRACAVLSDARRIGLAWSVQEWPAVPCDPWDVPLHAVATERAWIEPS